MSDVLVMWKDKDGYLRRAKVDETEAASLVEDLKSLDLHYLAITAGGKEDE